jgi:ADP-ribose pyrophosphatase
VAQGDVRRRSMKRIAVYGGAFDPPTMGHKYVVNYILDNNLADFVAIVPCDSHTFKRTLTNPLIRLGMTEAAFASHHLPHRVAPLRWAVYPDAIQEKLPSDTLSLMRYMRGKFSKLNGAAEEPVLLFVVGSDNVTSIASWNHSSELLSSFPFIAVPRCQSFPSSTEIRTGVSKGLSPSFLGSKSVCPAVEEIIKREGLYSYSKTLYNGKFLKLLERDGWEYVHRPQHVVGIIAITDTGELILVEQHRKPLDTHVLEIPAGLVDDGETAVQAAERELLEETGYKASSVSWFGINGAEWLPKSAGLTDESISYYVMKGCVDVRRPEEGIKVHVTTDPCGLVEEIRKKRTVRLSADAQFVFQLYVRGVFK